MMLNVLVESALRSLVLALAVGFGLWLTRVRSARLQMTAWTLVLAGALLMPLLMRWRAIEIHAPHRIATAAPLMIRTVSILPPVALPPALVTRQTDWRGIAFEIYAAVAVVLLVRLLTGLALSFRLWSRTVGIHELWAACADVRESGEIRAPVTFGSSILLPLGWRGWDELKLRAVMAHEGAHVAWGDFFVQLLGKVHAAVFWFSPMAWWLENRLILLAEAASDDAALETVGDRSSYAGILLGLARQTGHASVSVAMARPATVKNRVERILSLVTLPANPGWKRYVQIAGLVATIAAIVAGSSIRAQQEPASAPPPVSAAAPAAPEPPHAGEVDAWAIVAGDLITTGGFQPDANTVERRARGYRDRVSGDYVWFEHEGKEYLVTDPATVKQVQELLRPNEQVLRRLTEIVRQQALEREQQALLDKHGVEAAAEMPALDDVERRIRAIEMQLSAQELAERARNEQMLSRLESEMRIAKDKNLSQEALSELQAKMSDAQSRLSDRLSSHLAELDSRLAELRSGLDELQSRIAEKRLLSGRAQTLLDERQSQLRAEQSKFAEDQARQAEQASHQLRQILEDCLRNGLAHAAH